jgi:7,8-dihydropterin-6-yl-methyl-4-(beta-D-ribofuranosyl)aminobenzene 5'-phosphate synthase
MRTFKISLSAFLMMLLLTPLSVFCQTPDQAPKTKITILSENTSCGFPGIKIEKGFSVLIEMGEKQYLYDAGRTGTAVQNAKVLGKDITKIEKIFLSHGHLDHTGGLEAVLKAIGHPVEIYAHPDIFENKVAFDSNNRLRSIGIPFTKKYLEEKYGAVFHFHKNFQKVADKIWLTGEVPFTDTFEKIPTEAFEMIKGKQGQVGPDPLLDDNSVVIETDKGLVVILGCGHHGIINILTYIKKNLDKKIYALIGGTHLQEVNTEQMAFVKSSLERIFQEDQTKIFAPDHCTGPLVEKGFKAEFKDIFDSAACGTTLEF